MRPTTELLAGLRSAGVEGEVRGDRLRLRGPRDALTPARLDVLRRHKAELLAALTGNLDLPAPLVPHGGNLRRWAVRLTFLSELCRDLVPDRSK